jgi:hypothetical protein
MDWWLLETVGISLVHLQKAITVNITAIIVRNMEAKDCRIKKQTMWDLLKRIITKLIISQIQMDQSRVFASQKKW